MNSELKQIRAGLIAAQAQTPYHGKLNHMAHRTYDKALEQLDALEKRLEWQQHWLELIKTAAEKDMDKYGGAYDMACSGLDELMMMPRPQPPEQEG